MKISQAPRIELNCNVFTFAHSQCGLEDFRERLNLGMRHFITNTNDSCVFDAITKSHSTKITMFSAPYHDVVLILSMGEKKRSKKEIW